MPAMNPMAKRCADWDLASYHMALADLKGLDLSRASMLGHCLQKGFTLC